MTSRPHKWSKQSIRDARRADIVSLLRGRNIRLRDVGGGNFEMIDHPGLIVKNSFWTWPDQNRHGNTIDLFTQVLGLSFQDAMKIICRT